jgi:hypothetical protein
VYLNGELKVAAGRGERDGDGRHYRWLPPAQAATRLAGRTRFWAAKRWHSMRTNGVDSCGIRSLIG